MNTTRTISYRELAVLFWLMLCVLPVYAASDAVPSYIQNELTDARLSGRGSFRWFGLKIYDAASMGGRKANTKPMRSLQPNSFSISVIPVTFTANASHNPASTKSASSASVQSSNRLSG